MGRGQSLTVLWKRDIGVLHWLWGGHSGIRPGSQCTSGSPLGRNLPDCLRPRRPAESPGDGAVGEQVRSCHAMILGKRGWGPALALPSFTCISSARGEIPSIARLGRPEWGCKGLWDRLTFRSTCGESSRLKAYFSLEVILRSPQPQPKAPTHSAGCFPGELVLPERDEDGVGGWSASSTALSRVGAPASGPTWLTTTNAHRDLRRWPPVFPQVRKLRPKEIKNDLPT